MWSTRRPRDSDFGVKFKAGALSLLVPGAGQLLVNGDTTKGWVMFGTEAATWGVYFLLDDHADAWADDYREYASIHAGTAGEHPDWYWQAVGRYMDSDAYYESQLRDARAFGEPTPEPLPADDAWQWTSGAYQDQYQELRANATEAYDNRDVVILFAVLQPRLLGVRRRPQCGRRAPINRPSASRAGPGSGRGRLAVAEASGSPLRARQELLACAPGPAWPW